MRTPVGEQLFRQISATLGQLEMIHGTLRILAGNDRIPAGGRPEKVTNPAESIAPTDLSDHIGKMSDFRSDSAASSDQLGAETAAHTAYPGDQPRSVAAVTTPPKPPRQPTRGDPQSRSTAA